MVVGNRRGGIGDGECGVLPELLLQSARLLGCGSLDDNYDLRCIALLRRREKRRRTPTEFCDVTNGSLGVNGIGYVVKVAAVSLSGCLCRVISNSRRWDEASSVHTR